MTTVTELLGDPMGPCTLNSNKHQIMKGLTIILIIAYDKEKGKAMPRFKDQMFNASKHLVLRLQSKTNRKL